MAYMNGSLTRNLLELIKKTYGVIELPSWTNTFLLIDLVPLIGVESFSPPKIEQKMKYLYKPNSTRPVAMVFDTQEEQRGSLVLYEKDYNDLCLIKLKPTSDILGESIIIVEKVGTDNLNFLDGFVSIRVYENVFIEGVKIDDRKYGGAYKVTLDLLFDNTKTPFTLRVLL